MRSSICHAFVFVFILIPVWSAPVPVDSRPSSPKPEVFAHGDYVAVRPKHFKDEKKSEARKVSSHPAVVVNGPKPNGEYDVATISKKLPHNPPQKPIKEIHPGTDLYGNIQLGGSRSIEYDNLKPWKDPNTGHTQGPMPPQDLANLKTEMAKHKDWEPPPESPLRHNTVGSSNPRLPNPPTPNQPIRKNTVHGGTNPKAPAPRRKDSLPVNPSNIRVPVPLIKTTKSSVQRPQGGKVAKPAKSRVVKAKTPGKAVNKPAARPGAARQPMSKSRTAPDRKVGRPAAAKPKVVGKHPVAAKPKVNTRVPAKRPAAPKPKANAKFATKRPVPPASHGRTAKPAPKAAPKRVAKPKSAQKPAAPKPKVNAKVAAKRPAPPASQGRAAKPAPKAAPKQVTKPNRPQSQLRSPRQSQSQLLSLRRPLSENRHSNL